MDDRYEEIRAMSQEDRDEIYKFAVERSEEMSKEDDDD